MFLVAFRRCAVLSVFKMKNILLPVIVCLLVLTTFLTPCLADLNSNRSQLEKIKARIDRVEADLRNKKQSELNISRELALIGRTLKQVKRQVKSLRSDQKALRKKVEQQKQKVVGSKKNVKMVGKRLQNRLVALYKEGDAGALKILFSADSPTEMVQQYHYLTKVLQFDRELLSEYRQAIDEQQQHLDKLESLDRQKSELLKQQKQQQQIAEKGRNLQARLLKQARKDKKRLAQEVSQLKKNAERLQKLITNLEHQPEYKPTTKPVASDFAVGRGRLGWPVNGRVAIGFGQQKDVKLGTFYESNGIEITVATGSPIRAVAAGKIVFADYFKGYGNLYIISHHGGYHTLYAQTDKMNKDLNEQVSAGDVLGYSGLGGRESIYFEIRSKGSPVNPLSWLIKK